MRSLNTLYLSDMFEIHSRFVVLLVVNHFFTYFTFKDSTSERSDVELVKETEKLLRQELLNSPDVYSS